MPRDGQRRATASTFVPQTAPVRRKSSVQPATSADSLPVSAFVRVRATGRGGSIRQPARVPIVRFGFPRAPGYFPLPALKAPDQNQAFPFFSVLEFAAFEYQAAATGSPSRE